MIKKYIPILSIVIITTIKTIVFAQTSPKIVNNKNVISNHYLPDFSYAGYHNGEKDLPHTTSKIIDASSFGVIANDNLDDSVALKKALDSIHKIAGNVILQLPKGRIILSDILYIERSNFILRGMGTGIEGTEIYCPRPMLYFKNPPALKELREYLVKFNKRQREKKNHIDLPFSQYAWSGGIIWTQVPHERVKFYLEKYNTPQEVLANVLKGKRGEHTFYVANASLLKVGDIVQLELYNTEGKNGTILQELYPNFSQKIGESHWKSKTLPIVRQQVEISAIQGKKITIKTPLTIAIKSSYQAKLIAWKHLKEVGIEHLKITFPDAPKIAHHVEAGFNAIYLTRVYNSWVHDVTIHNADSGILTEEIANVTLKNITTKGKNIAHYTVSMGSVHNVLVENLKIYNKAIHPLSFNTFSTKNVYKNCEVFVDPILDQHSGANHQNLFDNITVHIRLKNKNSYPLFKGGGASYWKPSHGAYSTFWNIFVDVLNPQINQKSIELNGMKDGYTARIIGVHGTTHFTLSYKPNAYIEFTNKTLTTVPSLYDYQLKKRLKKVSQK